MKHLYVTEFGSFIGLESNLCVVKNKDGVICQQPLSRLKSINVHKGASVSSDLILACAERGIQIHFVSWNGKSQASINGMHTHAVVSLRKHQLMFVSDNNLACELSKKFILGKISNQRAVLQYFSKYHKSDELVNDIASLKELCSTLEQISVTPNRVNKWRDEVLGIEGGASVIYWRALRNSQLLPSSFITRDGRGSLEITNKALNYGYAILQSRVWNVITNAGLEPFAGVLHTDRPGKPSLVLDAMEVYRPWVIDRNIIKMRMDLEDGNDLTYQLKKNITESISNCLSHRYIFKNKSMKLETIMQRQAYILAGFFMGTGKYKAFRFKW